MPAAIPPVLPAPHPVSLICGKPDIFNDLIFIPQPGKILLPGDILEHLRTPPELRPRPSITPDIRPVLLDYLGIRFPFFDPFQHQILKSDIRFHDRDRHPDIPLHLCDMPIHLRKLQPGITKEDAVNLHPLFNHLQKHRCGILAPGKRYHIINFLLPIHHGPFLTLSKCSIKSSCGFAPPYSTEQFSFTI